jgi:hypothetical protein
VLIRAQTNDDYTGIGVIAKSQDEARDVHLYQRHTAVP